jgi:hypothetical protein
VLRDSYRTSDPYWTGLHARREWVHMQTKVCKPGGFRPSVHHTKVLGDGFIVGMNYPLSMYNNSE